MVPQGITGLMHMEAKNAIAKIFQFQKYSNFKNLSLSESEYFQMHFATISWDREAKVNIHKIFTPHFQFFDMRKRSIIIEKCYINSDITESNLGKIRI